MLLQKKILRTFWRKKPRGYIKEIDNPNEGCSKLLYDFSSLYEKLFQN